MKVLEFLYKLKDLASSPIKRLINSLKGLARDEEQAAKGAKDLKRYLEGLRSPAQAAASGLGVLKSAVTGLLVGAAALGGLALGAGFALKGVVDAAGYKEQQLINFRAMLGSASLAANVYANAVAYADRTPFETPDVVGATKQFLAFGVTTRQLSNYMDTAGRIAAGSSKPLEEVTRALTYLKSGNFGEGFQSIASMGISKLDLVGQGLVFDKSGSFKGTSEQAFNAVYTVAKKKFGSVIDDQSKSIFGLISTLQSVPFNLFSVLMPDNTDTKGPLEPFRMFLSNLTNLLNFNKAPGSGIATRFASSIGSLFEGIFGPLASATSGAKGEALVNGLIGWIDRASSWVKTNGPGLLTTMRQILGGIGQAIAFVVPIIQFLAPMTPAIIGFIAALSGLKTLIGAIVFIKSLGGAFTILRGLLPMIGGPWGLLIAAIIGGVMLIVANWGTIRPAIQPAINWLMTAFTNVGNFFATTVPAMIGIGVNWITTAFRNTVQFLGGVWQWITTAASNAFNLLKFLFLNFTPIGIIINNFAPIMAFFTGLPARFMGFGSAMLQGLVSGITGGLAAVKNSIVGAANSAIGWFKNVLGIKSPSRVFAGLGAQLPAGLERGINAGAGRVQKAVGALAMGAALSAGVTLDAGALSAAAQRDTSGAALSAGATAGTTSGASQAGGNARIEIALNITGSGVSKSDALELQGATLEGVKAALMQLGFELGGV